MSNEHKITMVNLSGVVGVEKEGLVEDSRFSAKFLSILKKGTGKPQELIYDLIKETFKLDYIMTDDEEFLDITGVHGFVVVDNGSEFCTDILNVLRYFGEVLTMPKATKKALNELEIKLS